MAIEQGLTILNWFEHLPKDEVPPEYLWEDGEGLELWWKSVDAKRDDGTPTGRATSDDDDDDSDSGNAENDLARFIKAG